MEFLKLLDCVVIYDVLLIGLRNLRYVVDTYLFLFLSGQRVVELLY